MARRRKGEDFSKYRTAPLKTIDCHQYHGVVRLSFERFEHRCPVVEARDCGRLQVTYEPDGRMLEVISFRNFLYSFEHERIGTEAVAQHIADSVRAAVDPRWVMLRLTENRQGYTNMVVQAEVRSGAVPSVEILRK